MRRFLIDATLILIPVFAVFLGTLSSDVSGLKAKVSIQKEIDSQIIEGIKYKIDTDQLLYKELIKRIEKRLERIEQKLDKKI